MRFSDLGTDVRQSARDVVLNGLISSPIVPRVLRWRLLRALGMRIEKSAINPRVWFGSRRVRIGHGTFINFFCKFDGPTRIGRNCNIGYDVLFCTSTHVLSDGARRAGKAISRPIEVGDGVWIGARAVIMPGVSIGPGCVVAAGALVTKDCSPGGIYVGVPAKRTSGALADAAIDGSPSSC